MIELFRWFFLEEFEDSKKSVRHQLTCNKKKGSIRYEIICTYIQYQPKQYLSLPVFQAESISCNISRQIHTFDGVLAECTSVLYAHPYVDCGMRDKLRKSVISTAMVRQYCHNGAKKNLKSHLNLSHVKRRQSPYQVQSLSFSTLIFVKLLYIEGL